MRKNNVNRITAILFSIVFSLQIVMIGGFTQSSDSKTFKDISINFWANEAINGMLSEGVIKGYPDGTFKPNLTVSREEFAVMICNAFDLELIKPEVPSFKDVDSSRWSYGYIEAAKDYLTGYQVASGKARFNPSGAALREDVAVAMVKVMKLEVMDIDPEKYLASQFYDVATISPGLYKEVAAGIYYKLISGNPNGSFEGDKPINRASVASLIFKAIKMPNQSGDVETDLIVNLTEQTNTPVVTMDIETSAGNKVYVNNKSIEMNGKNKQIDFELNKGEGDYTFEVKAITPQGRSIISKKQVHYTASAPVIELIGFSETCSTKSVTIKGTIKDAIDGSPKLSINNTEIHISGNGNFEQAIKLIEGENKITLKGSNKIGKSVELVKTVTMRSAAPEIDLSGLPSETKSSSFIIRGKVSDPSGGSLYELKAYFNDKVMSINSSTGDFAAEVTLKEGTNNFIVRITNSSGKTTEKTVSVNFIPGVPTINFVNFTDKVNRNTTSVSLIIDDEYDSRLPLFIDGKLKDNYYKGTPVNFEIGLKEGINTFVFKVVNSKGKEIVLTKTITFECPSTEIKVTSLDATYSQNYYLKVELIDENSAKKDLAVRVNGKTVAVDYYGQIEVASQLLEGENIFTIEVTNAYKKMTVLKYKVVFNKPAPVIVMDLPAMTEKEQYILKGKIISPYDESSYDVLKIMINGESAALNYMSFEKKCTLKVGENPIKIEVSSTKSGKSTVFDGKIVFNPSKPNLQVELPTETTSEDIMFSGSIFDENDDALKLTVNGSPVVYSATGLWNYQSKLVKGENIFIIEATNKYGLKVTVEKKITLK